MLRPPVDYHQDGDGGHRLAVMMVVAIIMLVMMITTISSQIQLHHRLGYLLVPVLDDNDDGDLTSGGVVRFHPLHTMTTTSITTTITTTATTTVAAADMANPVVVAMENEESHPPT